MNLNDWFHHGISKEKYIESLDFHRESFLNIYNELTIPSTDHPLFENKEKIRVIVLAEPWCGHCMLDIPILLRMTEQANMDVRFIPRDENLELMDQYVTNGKRYIPIFIFIDAEGNELAKWGPMAPEIIEYTEKLKVNVPEKDSPNYEDAFNTYVKELVKTFNSDRKFWNYVYEDIKKVML